MTGTLAAALAYAELGYPVLPTLPGKKIPACAHGVADATTDAAAIEAWWQDNPRAGVAVACSGLLVVDVDPGAGDWPGDPDRAAELGRAPCAMTPRGGRHYVFRGPGRNSASKIAPHVDTRGDGGYVVAAPSPGYRWINELDRRENLPPAPAWIVEALAEQTHNESIPENEIPEGQRDDTLTRLAGSMRRVGMSAAEIEAALVRVNADRCRPPLPDRAVARIARSVARYEPDMVAVAVAEDHWAQITEKPNGKHTPDPGPIPDHLLSVPGFVGAVADHCMATAPYPNRVMALAGALALQAILCARKIQDESNCRTNLYLLALAHSGAGKDWPRKINQQVLHDCGLVDSLGGKFASGEGIQDALARNHAILYQTDEIDGLIRSVTLSREARHEAIMGTLLEIYSSANGLYVMRHRAGDERTTTIDQPCLVLFGTAIPSRYYESLSDRMLANGFFARMLVMDAGGRGSGQDACPNPVPGTILDVARAWAGRPFGPGNLAHQHPLPAVVPSDPDAAAIFADYRRACDGLYADAESKGDEGGTAVWSRACEHARKLALVHAASADPVSPRVTANAARWSCALADHLIRRMLYMAGRHVSGGDADAKCLRLMRLLESAGRDGLSHSDTLRRMRLSSREFIEVLETCLQRGEVAVETTPTGGRAKRTYRAVGP